MSGHVSEVCTCPRDKGPLGKRARGTAGCWAGCWARRARHRALRGEGRDTAARPACSQQHTTSPVTSYSLSCVSPAHPMSWKHLPAPPARPFLKETETGGDREGALPAHLAPTARRCLQTCRESCFSTQNSSSVPSCPECLQGACSVRLCAGGSGAPRLVLCRASTLLPCRGPVKRTCLSQAALSCQNELPAGNSAPCLGLRERCPHARPLPGTCGRAWGVPEAGYK